MNAIPRHPQETRSLRMSALARLPVFFALADKRVVVAGGTAAAAWKAELLSAAGAEVDVFASDISDEMSAIAGNPPRGPVAIHDRAWREDDFTIPASVTSGKSSLSIEIRFVSSDEDWNEFQYEALSQLP